MLTIVIITSFLIQDWLRRHDQICTFGYIWAQLGKAEEEG